MSKVAARATSLIQVLVFFSYFFVDISFRQFARSREEVNSGGGGAGAGAGSTADNGSVEPAVETTTKKQEMHDSFTDLVAAVREIENRDSFENLAKALANAIESDSLNPSMGDLLEMKIR